jgi:hypothetical protein
VSVLWRWLWELGRVEITAVQQVLLYSGHIAVTREGELAVVRGGAGCRYNSERGLREGPEGEY